MEQQFCQWTIRNQSWSHCSAPSSSQLNNRERVYFLIKCLSINHAILFLANSTLDSTTSFYSYAWLLYQYQQEFIRTLDISALYKDQNNVQKNDALIIITATEDQIPSMSHLPRSPANCRMDLRSSCMVRVRSMSRYMSTAEDSAGLISISNSLGWPIIRERNWTKYP